MIQIKGVSEDEMNLVRVSRYFHENTEAIEAVVAKLGNVIGLDSSSIAAMTGFSTQRVGAIVRAHSATPEKKEVLTDFMDEHASNAEPVSKFTGKTKYVNIANQIIDLIDEMKLNPGDNLPTSIEMTEKFDVSIATITRAVNHLKAKGVITAKRGQRIKVA